MLVLVLESLSALARSPLRLPGSADFVWLNWCNHYLGMGQYLEIPFLVGWTSIYQLFWCSPGVQGFDSWPFTGTLKCNLQIYTTIFDMIAIKMTWLKVEKRQSCCIVPGGFCSFHLSFWIATVERTATRLEIHPLICVNWVPPNACTSKRLYLSTV